MNVLLELVKMGASGHKAGNTDKYEHIKNMILSYNATNMREIFDAYNGSDNKLYDDALLRIAKKYIESKGKGCSVHGDLVAEVKQIYDTCHRDEVYEFMELVMSIANIWELIQIDAFSSVRAYVSRALTPPITTCGQLLLIAHRNVKPESGNSYNDILLKMRKKMIVDSVADTTSCANLITCIMNFLTDNECNDIEITTIHSLLDLAGMLIEKFKNLSK